MFSLILIISCYIFTILYVRVVNYCIGSCNDWGQVNDFYYFLYLILNYEGFYYFLLSTNYYYYYYFLHYYYHYPY